MSIVGSGSIMDDDTDSTKDKFLEPQNRFWLRKRKRRNSDAISEAASDSISVCSLDISVASEPHSKRKKRLSKVVSLASLFSTPMRPVLKIGASLQRSLSGGKSDSSTTTDTSVGPGQQRGLLQCSNIILRPSISPSLSSASNQRGVKQQEQRQRLLRSWSQTVARTSVQLTLKEVKRQEAIFELFSGEEGMVQDLELIKTTYRNSLVQLNILTEQEAQCIFGDLDELLNLHSSLRDKLASLRDASGITKSIGHALIEWVPGLKCYVAYCSNHVWARAVLDEKKATSKRFQDFLQRCLESPFSRKLDLWTFLDVPRSRLVKYPLLIGEILRHTPSSHLDATHLNRVTPILSELLQRADEATGTAECMMVRSNLIWPSGLFSDELENATAVLCAGELKDNRGSKIHCFLFDKGFVLTRPARLGSKYTVFHPIIPACELEVDEVEPLRPVSSSRNARPTFRVSSADSTANSSHILMASDEHTKKRWMDSIKLVIRSALNSQSSRALVHVTPAADAARGRQCSPDSLPVGMTRGCRRMPAFSEEDEPNKMDHSVRQSMRSRCHKYSSNSVC